MTCRRCETHILQLQIKKRKIQKK
uniref:Uncharacterized protein n=1 Tax=Rhizophora mucronata TaxID=61149 RepID=A0A2P2QHP8_RHIMU